MKHIIIKTDNGNIYSGQCSYIDDRCIGFRVATMDNTIYTYLSIHRGYITHYLDLTDTTVIQPATEIENYPIEGYSIPNWTNDAVLS